MSEILKFLTENPTFYIATTDGDQPRVRPFGFIMEFEGRLYFCTNNQKEVYRQLKSNPRLEISATSKDNEWIRLSGKAVFDGNPAAKVKAFEAAPFLAQLYQTPENPIFEVFYLTDARATLCSMTGAPRALDM